jgi:hypothetical protein
MSRRILSLAVLAILTTSAALAADVRLLFVGDQPPAGARVLDQRGHRWLIEGPATLADLPGASLLPVPAPRPAAPSRARLAIPDTRVQALTDAVQWNDVLADLQWVVGLGNRYSFNPNIHAVADSLEARLAALGLATTQHDFDLFGTIVPNVIATQTGATQPDSVVVICAHFDATSEQPQVSTPGADDNASGTVAVLTAARLLAAQPLEYTVQYVLFGGEEQGLRGARAWTADQAAQGTAIVGALNFDMIGWWQPGAPYDLEIETNAHSRWIAEMVVQCATEYASMPYILHEAENIWWGDFYAFWEQGYAAVNHEEAWDWGDPDFNPDYHTTADDIGDLDPDFTTGNVRVAVSALATLAGLAGGTPVHDAPGAPAPVLSAWPNPFNGHTTLSLSAAGVDGPVRTDIFDLTGRRLRSVMVEMIDGRGTVNLDAVDQAGAPLPAGAYLVRAATPSGPVTGRVAYVP